MHDLGKPLTSTTLINAQGLNAEAPKADNAYKNQDFWL